jgi:nitrite reductase (NADH) small subunit
MDERAVCRGDDVTPDKVCLVEVDGIEVGLLRTGGDVVAFENVCPHQGGPVCDGEVLSPVEAVLDGEQRIVHERFAEHHRILICPWHGYSFDVATGECITDRKIRLRRWRARERDGLIYLTAGGRAPSTRRNAEAPDAP